MEILETKILKEEVNRVEVLGVMSTFYGNIAGIISNGSGFNVVIAYNIGKIEPKNYVSPVMVNERRAEELYNNLR